MPGAQSEVRVPHVRIPVNDHGDTHRMVDATGPVDEITPEGESGISGNSSVGCVERTNAPRTTKHSPSDRCGVIHTCDWDTVHSITHKKCCLAPERPLGRVIVERLVNWKRREFSSLDLLDAEDRHRPNTEDVGQNSESVME